LDSVGNPVRKNIISCKYQQGDSFTILIFGGSQGAHAINKGIIDSLEYLKDEAKRIKFIHQTGEMDYMWVKKSYNDAS